MGVLLKLMQSVVTVLVYWRTQKHLVVGIACFGCFSGAHKCRRRRFCPLFGSDTLQSTGAIGGGQGGNSNTTSKDYELQPLLGGLHQLRELTLATGSSSSSLRKNGDENPRNGSPEAATAFSVAAGGLTNRVLSVMARCCPNLHALNVNHSVGVAPTATNIPYFHCNSVINSKQTHH